MNVSNWNAFDFFSELTATNKLAQAHGFLACKVSGLEGFEEALANMQNTVNFVCVSDTSQGQITLANTPHTKRIKTVFLAMRHAVDDMDARAQCMDAMQELFRQFMSKLIREKIKLELNHIYLDNDITFYEIDKYFFSGCACAYFQIATDVFTDMRLNDEEWITE